MEKANDKNATENQCTNTWSTTAMDQETFSHRWTVKTFRNIWKTLEGDLISPDFRGLTTNQSQSWQIVLRKHKVQNVDYFGVFLTLTSTKLKRKDGDKLMSKAQFSILDKNDQSVYQQGFNFENFLTDSWSYVGFKTFLKADELLDTTKGFIVGDQLKIDCRITVLKRVKSYCSVSKKMKTTDSSKSMRQDYEKLLESADFHDVIINCGTQEFKAHKAILSARSSVFSAVFKTEMNESVTGKITITDFPDHIIKEMLQFIYCGKIKSKNENTWELLRIADKYNIADLVDKCCAVIPSILTSDNALEALMAIPAYNPADLKSKVISFVALNKATIMKTTTFQNMIYTDPELLRR